MVQCLFLIYSTSNILLSLLQITFNHQILNTLSLINTTSRFLYTLEGLQSLFTFKFINELLIYNLRQLKGSQNTLHEDVKKQIHQFIRTEDYILYSTSYVHLQTTFTQFLKDLSLINNKSKDSTAAEVFRKKIKLYIDNISLEMKIMSTFYVCDKAVDWNLYTHQWLQED